MFLRNSWYVVAWSKEVAGQPLARTVLNENIVIFRMESGEVAALEDRCAHRHLPLAMGKCVGETLQCGYHGLKYDRTGRCVSVPSQAMIPPTAKVKAYPASEKYGWIWVWMGEAEEADPARIPDFHLLNDPDYAAVGKTNHVASSYRLVIDNLLDLSHVGFVHLSTIGNSAFGEKGQLTVSQTEQGVNILRLVPNVPPPPTYVKTGRLPVGKNIDRWQNIDFIAPSFVTIHVGGAEAGTGALEGRYEHGLNIWVLNAMTPETETTTHYFWASVRKHALGDPVADHLFLTQVGEAFEEDRVILEAQQKVLSTRPDSWACALKADAGSVRARRFLDRLIETESSAA